MRRGPGDGFRLGEIEKGRGIKMSEKGGCTPVETTGKGVFSLRHRGKLPEATLEDTRGAWSTPARDMPFHSRGAPFTSAKRQLKGRKRP